VADVGISYAHADARLAIAVRKALADRGFSVWMDESDEPFDQAESIGLPWGQSHWEVITNEFASANVILVIDTPAWRRSEYCQAEYEFVREWGKWVEFVTIDDGEAPATARLDEIAELTTARQPVTGAHVRLVRSARLGAPRHTSRLERLLHRDEERDAQLVLASSPDTSGIVVTSQVARYARTCISRTANIRKRLRRIMLATTAVLAVMALTGVAAMYLARSAERSATQSAARSLSLSLAAQSVTEPDTRKALSIAHEADIASPGKEATEAVNVATANDTRLRTLVIGPENYLGATWAADAPVIVANTEDKLVVLDADTGSQLRSIELDGKIRLGTVAIARDASVAVFVANPEKVLHLADLHTGEVRATNIHAVNVATTGDGRNLWWAADNAIYRESFTALATAAPRRYPLSTPALAIDVSPERNTVDYIDATGVLHSARYGDAAFADSSMIPIVPAVTGIPSPLGEPIAGIDAIAEPGTVLAASVRRCGDNVFGGILGRSALKGTSFSVISGNLWTDSQFGSPQKPVCGQDDLAWYTSLMPGGPSISFGADIPLLPGGSERTMAISDPSGSRFSAITNNGRLYHIPAVRTRSEATEGARAMLRIGGSGFLVNADGQVRSMESGSITGTVSSPFAADSAVAVRDYGMLAAPDTLWRIDAKGRTSEILSLTNVTIYSLRGGADGQTFVGTTPDGLMLIDPTNGDTANIGIEGLQFGETPVNADISPDRSAVSFVTDAGRVGTVSIEDGRAIASPQFSDVTLPSGTRTQLAYVPDTGGLLVTPSDGVVRCFDDDLTQTSIAFYGGAVDHLTTVDGWAVLSSEALGTTLYAGDTLTVLDRLPPDRVSLSPTSVSLDPVAKVLTGLHLGDRQSGENSTRYQIPLPTI
jgi:hypothetical protein